MKNVALAIFIALLLSSSAFATNSMLQINSQTASGTNSVIDQSSVNMGIQVGDGNKLVQINEASASVANIEGSWNTPSSDGVVATAIAQATMSDVLIKQCQANLGIQVGRHNMMIQKNKADADIKNVAIAIANADTTNTANVADVDQSASASATASATAVINDVAIIQKQANLGIQVGSHNFMVQKNKADADVKNVAVAKANAKALNVVNSDPAGKNVLTVSQTATTSDVSASATANLDHSIIIQDQANLGIQIGSKNDLKQNNKADAQVDNVAVAKASGKAINIINVDQDAGQFVGRAENDATITQTAWEQFADAISTASLDKVLIKQVQTNLGVQVGKKNDMDQNNKADAEVKNTAKASAKSKAINIADVDQTAAGVIIAKGTNTANVNQMVVPGSTSDVTASLSQVAVKQVQTNLGVQVGKKNDMDQNNKAKAEAENAAISKAKATALNIADVDQTAIAALIGRASNTVTVYQTVVDYAAAGDSYFYPDNEYSTTATLNKIAIKQVQTNLGVQVGKKNDMDQNNKADANVENVAVAKAKTTAVNFADVDQSAKAILGRVINSATAEELAIAQSEAGDSGTISSHGGTPNQYLSIAEGPSDATNAATDHIIIKQDQSNIGVQVGNKNDMDQKNKANAEVENVAVAKVKTFAPNREEVGNNDHIVVPATQTLSESCSAALNHVIAKQDQNNIGVQVGYHNLMIQKNKDKAEVEQTVLDSINTLTDISLKQKESNLGVQVGLFKGLVQKNKITDEPTISDTHISTTMQNGVVVV